MLTREDHDRVSLVSSSCYVTVVLKSRLVALISSHRGSNIDESSGDGMSAPVAPVDELAVDVLRHVDVNGETAVIGSAPLPAKPGKAELAASLLKIKSRRAEDAKELEPA